jgi:hypothetical protein
MMTAQEFCYWLQGFFEVAKPNEITPEQAKMIEEHLQLVFTKVTGHSPYTPTTLPSYLTTPGPGHYETIC